MQIARMQHPAPRTLVAKAREAATALALTWRYGREALLAHYLRIVPYGNGSHGIAHAARFYFDKPAEDLSWAEIALLSGDAAIADAAQSAAAGRAGAGAAARRIACSTSSRARASSTARSSPSRIASWRRLRRSRRRAGPTRCMSCCATRQWRVEGADAERQRRSAHLRATHRSRHAAAGHDARAALSCDLARRRAREQVAVMVVERGTGAVLADLGSGDYADSHAGAIDFTPRAALARQHAEALHLCAGARSRRASRRAISLPDLPEGASGINNADGHFLGPMLPRQALANSRNVPATNLLRKVGLETSFRFLRGLGLHDLDAPADSFGLSMAIGSLPTTLERLVARLWRARRRRQAQRSRLVRGQRRRAAAPRVVGRCGAAGRRPFSPIRWRGCRASRAMARSNIRFPSRSRPAPRKAIATPGRSPGRASFSSASGSGRGDAGTMTRLSGAGSAARLAHAILLQLHNGASRRSRRRRAFPPPAGRVAVELCRFGGRRSTGRCGQTLTEWLRPDEMPDADETDRSLAARTER